MFKRMVSVITLCSFSLMTGLSTPAPVMAGDLIKIAVMDIKAKQGVNPQVTSSLTDLICTQIANIGTHEVIGRDDMQAILEHIADKQLLECDDTKCLAQVGGALGVQQLLSGNIGMVGTTYLVNMKLIDIDNAKVLKRISREYAGNEAGLIQEVKNCVAELYDLKVSSAPAPPAPAAEPALMPAQITVAPEPAQAAEEKEIKTEKKKGGFPWLWVGLGALVVGGVAVAAVLFLGGDEDLPVPPDFPNAFLKTGN